MIRKAVEIGFDKRPKERPVFYIADMTCPIAPTRFVPSEGDTFLLRYNGQNVSVRVSEVKIQDELVGEVQPFEDPYISEIGGLREGDALSFEHIHVFDINSRK